MKQLFICLSLIFLVHSTSAQAERFEAADSEGVTASRDDHAVYLKIGADVQSPITIPRLAAPLRSMHWEGMKDDAGLVLKPGLDTWQVHWKKRPESAAELVLTFDARPVLMSEIRPIEATGDGSLFLPAHLAVTDGEKIRYEPQPYKNTVGFWAGKEDHAMWSVQIDKPGRFNVAVLQGCGKGQGGSQAMMMFMRSGETAEDAKLDFEVEETGHWQNFQWIRIGEVDLSNTGELRVGVMPTQIKKAALMDIRAIHLIRLPDKKK